MEIISKIIDEDIEISHFLNAFELLSSPDINDELMNIDFSNIKNEEVIFFDIETTGLNVAKTKLYLIGYVYYKDNNWYYTQLFGNSPKDEKDLICEFKKVCANYKYLIHFNGDHFDVPYINTKCLSNNCDIFLDKLISIDLYTLIKTYKKHLGIPNCKQKTIEDFLNISRKDKYNGGELIFQYFDYVKTGDDTLYKNLLLHNAEDCIGMLKLMKITDYIKLCYLLEDGSYKAYEIDYDGPSCFSFAIKSSDSKNNDNNSSNDLTLRNNKNMINILSSISSKKLRFRGYEVHCSNDTCTFICNKFKGTLKHFFKDFQNYYYIPSKDCAMHKNVAKYFEPEMREKAKVSNCYVKKEGIFIPIFGEVPDVMIFKNEAKNSTNYILSFDENNMQELEISDLYNVLKSSLINLGK